MGHVRKWDYINGLINVLTQDEPTMTNEYSLIQCKKWQVNIIIQKNRTL